MPPFSRINPDLANKLQNYIASGMSLFGQPVVLRKYISASAGQPELGIADKPMYQFRPTQMELRQLSIEETQLVGGQDIRGTYEVLSVDKITIRDELVYNGEVFRFLSEPAYEVVGAVIYFKGIAQRGSITGLYA